MSESLKENLKLQLEELSALQSMFYNPGEIKVDDIGIVQDIKDYLYCGLELVPDCLDLAINLMVDGSKFEVCVSLPHEYPSVLPDIFVRNHKLNKTQHVELNKKLGEFLAEIPKGDPCIFSAISWLQDNGSNYATLEQQDISEPAASQNEELMRYWIYSHHIYSKTKRKALIDLANQLRISGFVMPGKPGIICVEGETSTVVEWWSSVKSMNWKKIFCKITESSKDEQQLKSKFLKFTGFEEKVFENQGPKFNHMDMGEFFRYLEQHELSYIFKDIFGVDVKSS